MASQTINARSEIDTSKMRIDPHSAMSDTHVPTYCLPEFGKDGVVKGELKDGYFVPAGAMLPCESKHDSRVTSSSVARTRSGSWSFLRFPSDLM
jgi:hypothetical protein